MNVWGENIKISIFGESHGEGIGIVIDGIPSGTALDLSEIDREMDRRAPGRNTVSTSRSEPDKPEILSGFFDGRTTGTPLAAIIRNTNTISKQYVRVTPIIPDSCATARVTTTAAADIFRGV